MAIGAAPGGEGREGDSAASAGAAPALASQGAAFEAPPSTSTTTLAWDPMDIATGNQEGRRKDMVKHGRGAGLSMIVDDVEYVGYLDFLLSIDKLKVVSMLLSSTMSRASRVLDIRRTNGYYAAVLLFGFLESACFADGACSCRSLQWASTRPLTTAGAETNVPTPSGSAASAGAALGGEEGESYSAASAGAVLPPTSQGTAVNDPVGTMGRDAIVVPQVIADEKGLIWDPVGSQRFDDDPSECRTMHRHGCILGMTLILSGRCNRLSPHERYMIMFTSFLMTTDNLAVSLSIWSSMTSGRLDIMGSDGVMAGLLIMSSFMVDGLMDVSWGSWSSALMPSFVWSPFGPLRPIAVATMSSATCSSCTSSRLGTTTSSSTSSTRLLTASLTTSLTSSSSMGIDNLGPIGTISSSHSSSCYSTDGTHCWQRQRHVQLQWDPLGSGLGSGCSHWEVANGKVVNMLVMSPVLVNLNRFGAGQARYHE